MSTAERPLTAKMEAFCAAWAKTGGNASASYKLAYDASKMDDASVRKRASELLRHAGVAARIAELRAKAAEKAEITVADVLRSLATNLQIAMGERTVRTKVMARDRESGAVSVAEVEISDRDGGVAAKTADILLKALGGYEVDHEQAAMAAAAARSGEDVPTRDVARAVLDILRTARVEGEGATEPIDDDAEDDSELEEVAPCGSTMADADLASAGTSLVQPAPPRIRVFNPATGRLE